ncbi:Luminal-binding protein [Linum grandiflorum]
MAAKPKMTTGGDVIGIDLGTTFSCVAVARDDKIEIIANKQGNRITPSFVAFAEVNSERLIGEAARNQAALNPTRTIFDAKRFIGKKFDDPEVQRDIKLLPYPIVNRDGKPYVEMQLKGGEVKSFSAQEISAMILGNMKEIAESYIGKPVTGAVVTVPAYFNDAQRKATKDAGTIAGLNILRIINEPTAGALAYGLINKVGKDKKKILVYDLGGGTFDVSVLEIDGAIFEVLATGGDTHLGGGDFDRRLMEYFIDLIKSKYKTDISRENKSLGRLRKECERAKRALSNQTQVRVEIDCFIQGNDFSEPLSRARFEELNLDLFKKTLEVVKTTMEDAKLTKSEIDEIVLVGGSTRIPRLREMLKEMFDGKEPCKGVNPDEAVAYGAAVLGANLSGAQAHATTLYDVTLCDVTPLSLGVEVFGGLMSVVIPRNTSIPTKLTGEYHTIEDQQAAVTIKVYQGERPLTKDCIELGRFVLSGIVPAPRGVAKIEETFEIDEDGILTVTAKEKISASGRCETLTITNYKGDLTKTEIERMIKEAIKMGEDDKIAKARVDSRNQLERYLYDIKNAMSNGAGGDSRKLVRDKMSWNEKRKVDASVEEASNWMEENQECGRKEDYDKKLKKLRDLWNPIITKIYGS